MRKLLKQLIIQNLIRAQKIEKENEEKSRQFDENAERIRKSMEEHSKRYFPDE